MNKIYPYLVVVLVLVILGLGFYSTNKSQDSLNFMDNHNKLKLASADKNEIEAVVKEVLRKNPELIIESIRDMNTRKAKEEMERVSSLVKAKVQELENDKQDPRVGDINAPIKLIEFFDYNCGYCKRMVEVKKRIVEENPDVQIIFKELPILGENSHQASKSALAVNLMDKEKYFQYQSELLNVNGPKTKEIIESIIKKIGLDVKTFNQLMDDTKINDMIAKNMRLAEEINVNGTPAYILGGEFLPGALPYEELKVKIDSEKAKKNNTALTAVNGKEEPKAKNAN